MSTLAEIAALLRSAGRMLALTHIAPDGDAIGSLLGFGWVLRAAWGDAPGRAITLACPDPPPAQLQWPPGITDVLTAPPPGPWDVVVGLDASDGLRLGSAFRPVDYGATPIVILDHHVTNLYFGSHNYVNVSAAATAQIIVDLADALDAPLDREAAACLLTGLVTDTLGFRTNNVTPQVMATAMRLMQAGASLSEVTERTLNHWPLNILRLWGPALSRQVVWVSITQRMRHAAGGWTRLPRAMAGWSANSSTRPKRDRRGVLGNRRRQGGNRLPGQVRLRCLADRVEPGRRRASAGRTIMGSLEAAEDRVLPLLFQAIE
jgi:phosphoesterase RecJ-like protein